MRPSDLSVAIETCLRASQPACIWGPPGIGKSAVVHQIAASTGRAIRDIRAVLLDPVDLRGLPHINGGGKAHWAIPEFLPREGSGILFLDELNRAPMLVQNACFQLVLDRKLGEYELPEGWQVISACNRESDGGGVTRMSSALSNRFVHLECDADLEDFCKWAVKANIEPAVIAFLRFRPNLLHEFSRTEKAFPSPRSWEFVSKITQQSPGQAIEHELYKGTVGAGAATEYSAFIKLYRGLPSIDAILLDPKKSPVPENDPASLFAVSCALARRATAENFKNCITYLDRLPEEYSVMSVKDAIARDSALATTGEFTRWAIKHADVVF